MQKKLGLVVEGGGVRAIYAAGVLDALHDMGLPFRGVIGVSAGAIHGCSFVSGQKERSLRIYTRFAHDERFYSLKTWLRTGSLVDNDFCYGEIPQKLEVFDEAAFEESPMDYWVTCTNVETGQPEYFHLQNMDTEIDGLVASASLPYVSKIVEFRGKKLLDGGCSDQIPLKAFQSMGFAKNIVVLTQPRSHRKKDRDAALATLFYGWRYPKFCETFKQCPKNYEETLRYIDEEEAKGNVIVIRPQEKLPIGRLSRDKDQIRAVHRQGVEDAEKVKEKIRAWIASFAA